ncbi:MAG TPA: hypothetical protein VHY10_18800 [Xanthobacteraceae bacterium]|nr:hypothetical protein [Xanthobacteraceae bacterium]
MTVQVAQIWCLAPREFGSVLDVDRGYRLSAEQGQNKGLCYEKSGFIVSSDGVGDDLRDGGGYGNQGASGSARTAAFTMGCCDHCGLDDGL